LRSKYNVAFWFKEFLLIKMVDDRLKELIQKSEMANMREPREGDIKRIHLADVSKAKELMGFKATFSI